MLTNQLLLRGKSIFYAALFLRFLNVASLFVTPPVYAEANPGDVAKVTKQTPLLREPTPDAQVLGQLPKNSVVRLLLEVRNGFRFVHVDLEEGELEGWIKIEDLGHEDDEDIVESTRIKHPEKLLESPSPPRQKRRPKIPQDEMWQADREKWFYFSFLGGGNVGFSSTAVSPSVYFGPGFELGGEAGMTLTDKITAGFQVTYSLISGTSGSTVSSGAGGPGGLNLQFGFLNAGAIGKYHFSSFYAFSVLRYAYGISALDVPASVVSYTGPSSLSSFWLQAGGGYRYPLSPIMDLEGRLSYGISLLQSSFIFQAFTAMLVLSFSG